MFKPEEMTTATLESNMRLYGIEYETFLEWSDEDAARIGAIIIEWSKR